MKYFTILALIACTLLTSIALVQASKNKEYLHGISKPVIGTGGVYAKVGPDGSIEERFQHKSVLSKQEGNLLHFKQSLVNVPDDFKEKIRRMNEKLRARRGESSGRMAGYNNSFEGFFYNTTRFDTLEIIDGKIGSGGNGFSGLMKKVLNYDFNNFETGKDQQGRNFIGYLRLDKKKDPDKTGEISEKFSRYCTFENTTTMIQSQNYRAVKKICTDYNHRGNQEGRVIEVSTDTWLKEEGILYESSRKMTLFGRDFTDTVRLIRIE